MTADDDDKSFQKNGQTMIEKESTVGFNVDEVFRKVNAKLLLALLLLNQRLGLYRERHSRVAALLQRSNRLVLCVNTAALTDKKKKRENRKKRERGFKL